MTMTYGDGTNSTIGSQFRDFYYYRKALIELKDEQFFTPLADVTTMPKHMGKRIKRLHYLPILSDANINDQGIDATGARTVKKATLQFLAPETLRAQNGYNTVFVTAYGADDASALTAAKAENNVTAAFSRCGYTLTWDTDYATTRAALVASGWKITDDSGNGIPGVTYQSPVFDGGNLYGSSKDIGTIVGKLPTLSEKGGRVNRVGFTRVEVEGGIDKMGFFDEYSAESMNFDTDSELDMHVSREMIRAAQAVTEAQLQIDLLNGAGIVKFAGDATSTSELTGEVGATVSVPTYLDYMKVGIDLDNNRAGKSTTRISGSLMTDTKTVQSARYMYIGSELITQVKKVKGIDDTDKKGSGFISVEKYAEAGTIAPGEIGQIDQLKVIVVPDMLHWDGAGAPASDNAGYMVGTNGNYNVYPMLVVGDKSFATIGFQSDGKSVKFKIKHVKPETDSAYSTSNPFGELGFMSIKWYYGTMIWRPEHIALIKCVAEY